jgi:hypothetical protein
LVFGAYGKPEKPFGIPYNCKAGITRGHHCGQAAGIQIISHFQPRRNVGGALRPITGYTEPGKSKELEIFSKFSMMGAMVRNFWEIAGKEEADV